MADEVSSLEIFNKINNFKLIWIIQNVYQCRTLLSSCIDGPNFRTESTSPFPWVLRLGQSVNPENNGIALFIDMTGDPVNILLNFHINVRKKTYSKHLFHKFLFANGRSYESPLLISNDEFRTESYTEKFCGNWEIRVELKWGEKVEPENVMRKSDDVSLILQSFKEIGNDLKKFFRSEKFCDIYIQCGNEKIPAHKAILEARCPYFAQKIDSCSCESWECSDGEAQLKDPNTMKAFLMYLYTGDFQSMVENYTLPVGFHRFAHVMRKYDLESLSFPTQLDGITCVTSEIINYDWIIGDLHRIYMEQDASRSIYTNSFGSKNVKFILQTKPSEPYVSLSLHLGELAKANAIYVIFNLVVIKQERPLISVTREGDMILNRCIEFPNILSRHQLLEMPYTCFSCKISCFGSDFSSHVDTPLNSTIKPDKKSILFSPTSKEEYEGHINLSCDLSQLLITANHSDCFVIVGDMRFPAHRIILAARSPYFSAILEAKEEECKHSSRGMEIFVEENLKINTEMMKIILEEIYTGSSAIHYSSTYENNSYLMSYAKVFGLKTLQKKCTKISEDVLLDKHVPLNLDISN